MGIATNKNESAQKRMPHKLVYVSDDSPGICRLRRGKHFFYRDSDGQRLTDARELERIQKLAIPPAYTAVWICPSSHGHLQATGRDARERKQYIYHPEWRLVRDEKKFDRLSEFGEALPRIRAKVRRDLDAAVGAPVSHQTVIAAIVYLLDTTLVRIGNDEYARSNGSFGLTTLRKRHVAVRGGQIRLHFRGKSGVTHEVTLQDKRIARIVKRCQALLGQELFKYVGQDGVIHSVNSTDVNEFLRTAGGGEFTAKDFRTWHGSVYAMDLWNALGEDEKYSPTAATANELLAEVAKRLGNTVAVCRKSYIHPSVLTFIAGRAQKKWLRSTSSSRRIAGLLASERKFLALLKLAIKDDV